MIQIGTMKSNKMDLDNDPISRYWGRRVIVLGAAGFIGRWLAKQLIAYGAQVYLLVRNPIVAESVFQQYEIEGEVIEQEVTSGQDLEQLIHKIKPSVVFNLIDLTPEQSEQHEEQAFQLNADLVMTLCDYIAGSRDPSWEGQDIVQLGSGHEYGHATNWGEETTDVPHTVYGRSKLEGTRFLTRCSKAYGLRGLVARAFSVYGPGERSSGLLPTLLAARRNETPIPLNLTDSSHDWIYVEDVAEGLGRLGLATAPNGQVVNLATGRWTSTRDYIAIASKVLQISPNRLQFEIQANHHGERTPVPLSRLQALTSWVPSVSIEEGIKRTAKFENIGKDRGESD